MAINNIASTSLEKSGDSRPTTCAAAQMPDQSWDELPCTDEGRRTSAGDGTCAPAHFGGDVQLATWPILRVWHAAQDR